jgi:hypothetical protein
MARVEAIVRRIEETAAKDREVAEVGATSGEVGIPPAAARLLERFAAIL